MLYQTVTVRENWYQMGANRDFAAGGYFRNKHSRHYMKQTDSWRLWKGKYLSLVPSIGLLQRATMPCGIPQRAQAILLRPWTRLEPGGMPDCLSYEKTEEDTRTATNSCKKREPQHKTSRVWVWGLSHNLSNPLTSLTISWTSRGYFDSWLTPYQRDLRTGTASSAVQSIYSLNLLYYFLIVCQESIFCPALCLYLFHSCCYCSISSAYAFNSLWDYLKRYKKP